MESGAFQNVAQVQLVDGDQILIRKHIFLDTEKTGSAKIDDAVILFRTYNFTDTVIFGGWAVIHQVAQLNAVNRPPVKRVNDRQKVEPIR